MTSAHSDVMVHFEHANLDVLAGEGGRGAGFIAVSCVELFFLSVLVILVASQCEAVLIKTSITGSHQVTVQVRFC